MTHWCQRGLVLHNLSALKLDFLHLLFRIQRLWVWMRHRNNGGLRTQYVLTELTWFLCGDIDYDALWTHSCTVVGLQVHVVGAAALQVPDEHWGFIPHRPDDLGRLLLFLLAPVSQLRNTEHWTFMDHCSYFIDTIICFKHAVVTIHDVSPVTCGTDLIAQDASAVVAPDHWLPGDLNLRGW